MDGPILTLFVLNISWRLRQRLFRLRDGARGVRHLAAHHHADPDRDTHRRLWSADAGLRHRQFASGAELAKYLATRARHRDRNPDRGDFIDYTNPSYVRFGVGVLLVLYAIYSLACPAFKPMQIGIAGVSPLASANGLLGGLTGLGGVISTISCQLRGWPKDKQRAVFQPVLLRPS